MTNFIASTHNRRTESFLPVRIPSPMPFVLLFAAIIPTQATGNRAEQDFFLVDEMDNFLSMPSPGDAKVWHKIKPNDFQSETDNITNSSRDDSSEYDRYSSEYDHGQHILHSRESSQTETFSTRDSINTQKNSLYGDEQTYLDLFGERAKELLTQHIIPTTDAKCRWDWRTGRCEPYCECGFHFLWGDFHLGRSCRLDSQFIESQKTRGTKEGSIRERPSHDEWRQWTKDVDNSQTESDNLESKSDTCGLPVESIYTQSVYHLTRLIHYISSFRQKSRDVQKFISFIIIKVKNHVEITKQKSCQALKREVLRREREKNHPIRLTRSGKMWIRRLCSAEREPTDGIPDKSVNAHDDEIKNKTNFSDSNQL